MIGASRAMATPGARPPAGRGQALSMAAIQRRFFALVTAREGVAATLRARRLPASYVAAFVAGDARLDPIGRLDVYATMYFQRLHDVLRADYPKLAAALGDGAFWNLATDYLQACPSRDPSVRHVGGRLPGFLRRHPIGRRAPWLAELAALEWARVMVYDAADGDTMTLAAARGARDPARLRLRLIAAATILKTSRAVDDAWARLAAGHRAGRVPRSPRAILVWRREGRAHHRRLDADEARLMPLLRAGTTFGIVCARLGRGRTPPAAARRAGALLGRWIAAGLLRAAR